MATPTNLEQELLQLINRARSDPFGEVGRLITGTSPLTGANADITSALNFFKVDVAALRSQLTGTAAVAPLAWNSALGDAASLHSAAMIQFDQQSHQLPNESGLGARFQASGYNNLSSGGENVYAFAANTLQGHAGFYIDWGSTPTGMQDPPGHRLNILSSTFTEIGVDATAENNPATAVGPLVITQDFGSRSNYAAQIVGVVFRDADGDNFYDAGEGQGNVNVTISGTNGTFSTSTWSSGGYEIAAPAGSYTVTFSGSGLASSSSTVTLAGQNVAVDYNVATKGAAASNLVDLGSHGAAWPVSGVGDFNADGTSDILWRNPGTGQVDQWQMQGGQWSKSIDLGATKGSQWQLAGVGDFNADGTSDVLWRDINNSQVDQWQMKNGNWSKSIDLGATKGAQWTLAGVGDFNADGTSDVLWRNVSTGQVDQWQMKNGNWSKSIDLGATKGADWQLAGVGDFNGDGTTDVLWRNLTTSQVDQWQMKNGNWSKSIDLGATKGQDWTISGIGDANGDRVADIFWFNTKTGQSEHWVMSNGNWSASVDDGQQSASLKPSGAGDFNHDGKSEILLLNPDNSHLFDLIV